MIIPIVAYGSPILNIECDDIDSSYPDLNRLIKDMFETMYHANGVGLAAPQIGQSIRVFIVDSEQLFKEEENSPEKGIKKVFINADIIEESGDFWSYNEGCLSIPGVREDIQRMPKIKIKYYDENFKEQEEIYEGVTARVIQHEYDHVDGILFTDHLKPLKKKLLRKKLNEISIGKVKVDYRMKFPK